MVRPKIGLIGSGNIGGTMALLAGTKDLGDVILYDVIKDMPQGKALDLNHHHAVDGCDWKVTGTNDYNALDGCDVVIITAGLAQKPGQTREELVGANSKIQKQVAQAIKEHCPKAFVICITNPLDVMVHVIQKESGLPHNMVCGMGGIVDSSRFEYLLAQKLGVSTQDVHGLVLGAHGDSMVPCPSTVSVAGIPLSQLVKNGQISQKDVDECCDRSINSAKEIIDLLKTGSSFNCPALSALKMAQAYLHDERRVVPCCAYCKGEFGVDNMYTGVPAVIGGKGIERIVALDLPKEEKEKFDKSVATVKKLLAALDG